MKKYVLVKYKGLKLLVDETEDLTPLVNNLDTIIEFEKKMKLFYKDLMNATNEQVDMLESERCRIINAIGLKPIGTPFDSKDAELYAYNENLEFEIFEIEE